MHPDRHSLGSQGAREQMRIRLAGVVAVAVRALTVAEAASVVCCGCVVRLALGVLLLR
jgi:hypothetical protein